MLVDIALIPRRILDPVAEPVYIIRLLCKINLQHLQLLLITFMGIGCFILTIRQIFFCCPKADCDSLIFLTG